MNLLDLVVKITCDDEASKKITSIGSSITGTFGKVAGGIGKVAGVITGVMSSAAVVGAAAIAKSALDSYASYEQLVGGMDTLFKGASGTIQQYAANAYQTAGVSANRYMEISTSFAASLISSLGGDTAKAAEMANMAITDMSDNANKMGTSLETVQEAYMSLSRGNYEMLDSLALGYAGTKAGLEDLLNDAEKYAAAQGEVRDFSVDSYADIVEAIHIVQTEMGITGTTAEEAASTIEGSINMAKAAWENWLTGLGNSQADMGQLTDQLVQSVATAADNIIPRVGLILGTLVDSIIQYGPSIASSLGSTILNGVVDAFNQAAEFVASGLNLPAPHLDVSQITAAIDSVMSAVQWFADTFSNVFGPAIEAGQSVISALGSGFQVFGQAVNDLVLPAIEQLSPIFQTLFETISAAEPVLTLIANVFGVVLASALSVAIQLFGTLVQGVTGFFQILQGLYDFIVGFVTGVVEFFTVTLPTGFNSFVSFVSGIPGQVMSFLSGLLGSIAGWVGNMISNAVSAGSGFVNNIISFLSGLPGSVAGFLSGVIGNVVGFVSNMASNAVSAASQFASNLISGLQSIPGRVVSIGSDIINGIRDGVVNAAQRLIDAVGDAINGAIGWAKSLLGIASPSKVFRVFGQYTMQGMALGVDDDADRPARSIEEAMNMMASSVSPIGAPAAAAASSGPVYNLYVDGSLVRVDSRIGKHLDAFVDDVARELGLR